MGPALSEGQFIYGSTPANLFLSIYQGRPNGMPAWGELLPKSTIWELVAYVQSIAHPPSATFGRTISRTPQSPSVEQTPAEFLQTRKSMELHDPLQQRPKASRRVSAMRAVRVTILSTALCAGSRPARPPPPRWITFTLTVGWRKAILPSDAGSADRLRRRCRYHLGAGPDRHFAPRSSRRRGGTPLLEGDAKGWISIGVGLSTIVLVGLVVWTSVTMARIANPPSEARFVDRGPRPSMVVGIRLSQR